MHMIKKTLEEAMAKVKLSDEVQIIVSDLIKAKPDLEDAVLADC